MDANQAETQSECESGKAVGGPGREIWREIGGRNFVEVGLGQVGLAKTRRCKAVLHIEAMCKRAIALMLVRLLSYLTAGNLIERGVRCCPKGCSSLVA